jgi:hypothetical protein
VSARLEWRVRESLIRYMQQDESFNVELAGGGLFTESAGIVLPVSVDGDGAVLAVGAVTLSAHNGSLAVALVNASIEDLGLWIDDPLDDALPPARLRLVDLKLSQSDGADGRIVFETKLAADADVLFSYIYPVGSPFADLYLVDDESR